MTTLQLNAELFNTMGMIADDEALMVKLLKYAKKLAAKRQDPTLMTEHEFFAKVDKAREQIRRGEGYAMLPGESFKDFRKRIGR